MFKKLFFVALILLFVLIPVGIVSANDNASNNLIVNDAGTDSVMMDNICDDLSNTHSNLLNDTVVCSDNIPCSNNSNILNTEKISSSNECSSSNITNLSSANVWYVNGSAISNGSGSMNNPFKTLNEAINSANDGDTIYIASGTYTDSNNINLNINKSLSLIKWGAENPIFDAQSYSAIFNVDVTSLNIIGLTFKNGMSNYGGAIYFTKKISGLNLINCSFMNNSAENGGAIYFTEEISDLNLINCSFINNNAYSGGAIYFNDTVNNMIINSNFADNIAFGCGGAIYFMKMVSNSTIEGDYLRNIITNENGDSNGGAIFFNDVFNSTIGGTFKNNVAFSYNDALGSGGAIFIYNITNSNINAIFANNSADYGGAIFFSEIFNTTINSSFIDHSADIDGGAIYFLHSVSDLNINSIFKNNSADHDGGAIFFTGNVFNTNINSNFTNNSADHDGGAIFFTGNVSNSKVNSNFTENLVNRDGGAIFFTGDVSNSTINSDFEFNIANHDGGAIFFDSNVGNSSINSSFTENYVNNNGGAIYFNNSVIDTNIEGLFVKNSADYGAAIYFENFIPDTVINADFKDNIPRSRSVVYFKSINSTDIVKMYKNETQFYATLLDNEGKYLTNGTIVKFIINNVTYERKISGGKGLAKININLPYGKYEITTINPITGENNTNQIVVLSLLVENENITKYFKNATQYTVKVLGADGNAVGAGETVKFNINGVFYERKTNASGIVKLNINLPQGIYIVTAEYMGCAVSNLIKVLPVLSAKDISMHYRDGTKFVTNLLDGQGKPYMGQSVVFNVNGRLYNRTTDSNGQAKLNINLMPGQYIITSSYNGVGISNMISVLG